MGLPSRFLSLEETKDGKIISRDKQRGVSRFETAVGHQPLVRLMKSPDHDADCLYEVFEPTPALVFGRALHPSIYTRCIHTPFFVSMAKGYWDDAVVTIVR
jgi:hypothetical protein